MDDLHLLDPALHQHPEAVGDQSRSLEVHHFVGDQLLHHAQTHPDHLGVLGLAALDQRVEDLFVGHHQEVVAPPMVGTRGRTAPDPCNGLVCRLIGLDTCNSISFLFRFL